MGSESDYGMFDMELGVFEVADFKFAIKFNILLHKISIFEQFLVYSKQGQLNATYVAKYFIFCQAVISWARTRDLQMIIKYLNNHTCDI